MKNTHSWIESGTFDGVVRVVVAIIILLRVVSSAPAEIVYDSRHGNLEQYHASILEFGDECKLAGLARTVVRFEVEYFGDFTAEGDEQLVVRFYRNEGPGEPAPAPSFPPIYESDPFSIAPGRSLLTIEGLAVDVPDKFTWTVHFSGLSGVAGDRAGLLLNGNPKVGFSFNDFWQRSDRGIFSTQVFPPDGPVANFAARIFAVPDPPVRFTGVELLDDGNQTRISMTGPIGNGFTLQATDDFQEWTDIAGFIFQQSSYAFPERARDIDWRFYRVVVLPATILSVAPGPDGSYLLRLAGPSGSRQLIQSSRDLETWTTRGSVQLFGGEEEFIDTDVTDSTRFYRVLPVSPEVDMPGESGG